MGVKGGWKGTLVLLLSLFGWVIGRGLVFLILRCDWAVSVLKCVAHFLLQLWEIEVKMWILLLFLHLFVSELCHWVRPARYHAWVSHVYTALMHSLLSIHEGPCFVLHRLLCKHTLTILRYKPINQLWTMHVRWCLTVFPYIGWALAPELSRCSRVIYTIPR